MKQDTIIGINYSQYRLKGWKFPKIRRTINLQHTDILVLEMRLESESITKEGSRNLISIDKKGTVIWVAEIPKSHPTFGFFQDIKPLNSERIHARCGNVLCEIEIKSGIIAREEFILPVKVYSEGNL